MSEFLKPYKFTVKSSREPFNSPIDSLRDCCIMELVDELEVDLDCPPDAIPDSLFDVRSVSMSCDEWKGTPVACAPFPPAAARQLCK